MNFAGLVSLGRIFTVASRCQCICQQREQELSFVLKRVCRICVSALFICHFSLRVPQQTFTPLLLLSISFLPGWWCITSLYCRLPFRSSSLSPFCSCWLILAHVTVSPERSSSVVTRHSSVVHVNRCCCCERVRVSDEVSGCAND